MSKKGIPMYFKYSCLIYKNKARDLVNKALKVNILLKYTKSKLINDTKHFINKYCRKSSKERPLFLQKGIPDIGNRK